MSRPDLSRVPEWYHKYINQVKESDLLTALKNQTDSFIDFLNQLPKEKRDYRYGPDKWTIKEVVQHIIDAERVFAYRALAFARKEQAALPSFDENEYAENSKAAVRDWDSMIDEFRLLRMANHIMFAAFDEEQLESSGIASGKPVYVKAIGFIMVGHINHHVNITRERYL